MRTALGCPEALGLLGSCPMYRDGGRGGAAASRFLRRVWCTQKALTNGYVNQGVDEKTALGGLALWARTQARRERRSSELLQLVVTTATVPT